MREKAEKRGFFGCRGESFAEICGVFDFVHFEWNLEIC
jgi:hypothetical protein